MRGVVSRARQRFDALVQKAYDKTGLDIKKIFFATGKTSGKWTRDVSDRLVTLGVFLGTAWLLSAFFLSMSDMMWYIYLETAVGKAFIEHRPLQYQLISKILKIGTLDLSFGLCLMVLKSCLLAGALTRLLLLTRIIYDNRGFFIKYLFWPGVCAFSGSWMAGDVYGLDLSQQAWLLLMPAMIICVPCFELARRALPELDLVALIKKTRPSLIKYWQVATVYYQKWR